MGLGSIFLFDENLSPRLADTVLPMRINLLIQDALRQPFAGIGKPEPLRENLSGFWLRRIDDSHRLVYAVEAGDLVVIACRYHYA